MLRRAGSPTAISVILPAHNEAGVIVRTLTRLLDGTEPGEFDIIVVCNGCSDSTADRARSLGPSIRVLELVEPSKHQAMRAGSAMVTAPIQVFMDADVSIAAADLRRLGQALVGDIKAAGPHRHIAPSGSRLIDAYYRTWQRLPQVRNGLFGRGVIALSDEGSRRVGQLPAMMSDDLIISECFTSLERTIVPDAVVEIQPPRRLADLLKRRVRVVTGNAQADQRGMRGHTGTTMSDVLTLCSERPTRTLDVVVFVGVTVVARLAARGAIRRGDFETWLRDDSSRD